MVRVWFVVLEKEEGKGTYRKCHRVNSECDLVSTFAKKASCAKINSV